MPEYIWTMDNYGLGFETKRSPRLQAACWWWTWGAGWGRDGSDNGTQSPPKLIMNQKTYLHIIYIYIYINIYTVYIWETAMSWGQIWCGTSPACPCHHFSNPLKALTLCQILLHRFIIVVVFLVWLLEEVGVQVFSSQPWQGLHSRAGLQNPHLRDADQGATWPRGVWNAINGHVYKME